MGVWAGMAQGKLRGVLGGVQVAELEGHVSRSAVYLVHKEVRTGARLENSRCFRQASIAKKRMLSHAEYKRPVICRTRSGRASMPFVITPPF